jgi:hypothetical protein
MRRAGVHGGKAKNGGDWVVVRSPWIELHRATHSGVSTRRRALGIGHDKPHHAESIYRKPCAAACLHSPGGETIIANNCKILICLTEHANRAGPIITASSYCGDATSGAHHAEAGPARADPADAKLALAEHAGSRPGRKTCPTGNPTLAPNARTAEPADTDDTDDILEDKLSIDPKQIVRALPWGVGKDQFSSCVGRVFDAEG